MSQSKLDILNILLEYYNLNSFLCAICHNKEDVKDPESGVNPYFCKIGLEIEDLNGKEKCKKIIIERILKWVIYLIIL